METYLCKVSIHVSSLLPMPSLVELTVNMVVCRIILGCCINLTFLPTFHICYLSDVKFYMWFDRGLCWTVILAVVQF